MGTEASGVLMVSILRVMLCDLSHRGRWSKNPDRDV